ncbi:MAG TPA: hypothetical protein VG795_02650 [Acidimicrobiia bacterium]|nr:hypothetical protein [Acidimicrobiia bacterium]
MARRSLRASLAAVALLAVAAACTPPKDDKASFSGDVKTEASTPVFTGPESTEPTTSTTALSVTAVVPGPEGIGPLPFGMQAARAMSGLTQALGRAEKVTPVPAGANCGATRVFRWKDFDVLINEVSARSGGTPGLVGWSLGPAAPSSLGLKTDKGIGLGSTVAAVKAAYGAGVTVAQGANGPVLAIRTGNGVMTGELDGANDAGRVKTLRAGASCAV